MTVEHRLSGPKRRVATPIVPLMDELFAVDAEARRRRIDLSGRHALRQERARHLLDDIRSKIEAAHFVTLPASTLNKACNYALTLWKNFHDFWNTQNLS
jgi:Transposase IS66 family